MRSLRQPVVGPVTSYRGFQTWQIETDPANVLIGLRNLYRQTPLCGFDIT
jgi:hypothetical protein